VHEMMRGKILEGLGSQKATVVESVAPTIRRGEIIVKSTKNMQEDNCMPLYLNSSNSSSLEVRFRFTQRT
jgi:hypothetical protein